MKHAKNHQILSILLTGMVPYGPLALKFNSLLETTKFMTMLIFLQLSFTKQFPMLDYTRLYDIQNLVDCIIILYEVDYSTTIHNATHTVLVFISFLILSLEFVAFS